MIAKRVHARSHTSRVSRLVRYIVNAQGGLDPRSWARTADYILDQNAGKNRYGEKVGGVRVTNCASDDPAEATQEIQLIQSKNTRSKNDKTYHLVFSFPPGEEPPLETLHAIEDELCASIGYADHQRISAVHIDTDHLHVHVAINKVHPIGHQNIEPFYDKRRLMEACERLEIKYDLQRTNHGLKEISHEYNRKQRIQLGPEQRPSERDTLFRSYLRQSYNLALTEPPEAQTLNGLRNLSCVGVARHADRNSVLLQSHARSSVEQSGTDPVDGLRRAGNGDRTDAVTGRDQRLIGDRVAAVEAQSGIQTLAGYVSHEVAPALRAASSWQGVHDVLAEHGLQIKPRGAGLVIGDPAIPLWTRASQCGREFSMRAMTSRLGTFTPPQSQGAPKSQGVARARQGYRGKPVQTHPSTAQLYAQYQRERQNNLARRKTGLSQLRAETAKQSAELRNWKAMQRALLKAGGRGGAVRKIMSVTIREQSKAAATKQRKIMAERRAVLVAATTMPSWNDWLAGQAESGNVDALEVLRSRAEKEAKLRDDLLTAERAERAKTYIMESMRPAARRDGVMTYRTADGGVVLDRRTVVQAQKTTTGAALVALSLAAERFTDQALIVEGSDEFRRDVARLAGLHKINVIFKDAAMEATRKAVEAESVAAPKVGEVAPKNDGSRLGQQGHGSKCAVDLWIEQRNSYLDKISSIDYHRKWQSADAGTATYQGRRKMQDGSEVLLLKRGDEMLVKNASPAVVAKASKWQIGRRVQLDARGRFIDNSRVTEL